MRTPQPPATTPALHPPASTAFPYEFFQNVAQFPFDPSEVDLNLRNAWRLMDAAFLNAGFLSASDKTIPLPGFLAGHAPISDAIRVWNCSEVA